MSKNPRRWLVPGLIIAALIVIQFFRPGKNLGEVETAEAFIQVTAVPDTLARIFMNSCYDCHSNYTRYPWYGSIAPVSWFLNSHVVEGKAHLNFSSWALLDKAAMISRLDDICSECSEGTMPLKSYLWLHPNAELSPAEVEAICNWTEQEALRILGEE
jgi:hypothetical protein